MEITYAISTFPGDREQNEDFAIAGCNGGRYCFAVADGLGGHGRGEVASGLVCETALQCFQEQELCSVETMFEKAQERLLQRQREENAVDAMKTTLNMLVVDERSICGGHIGDTRTYYFRRNKLISRTKDHSVPQMMVSMGEIKDRDIRRHVDRNRLLRVMGTEWDKPQYVLSKEIRPEHKQAFLLCTDGFWEYIEDKEMEKCLKKATDVQNWLDTMNAIVCENGRSSDMDNYTALAVWIR
ncbi:MAG: protein phosphatase 2C domain-containing protein [Firmicutes bacterium]|nr:protein phosphatase 2C domain-containing protein [Bacillota bacterium]